MTALADLNAWRAEMTAKGCRVGVAEEIMWLCGRMDSLIVELEQITDRIDAGS